MIFALAFVAVWIGFTPHPTERQYVFCALLFLFIANIIMSFLPCYSDPKFEIHRIGFNIFTILFCFSLAFGWYLFLSTNEEVQMFFGSLMLSYVWLFVGFLFYTTKFPESYFTKEKFGPRVAYYV
jgi:predicted membrane channel-forming protein YqfA (hemolysin III family)